MANSLFKDFGGNNGMTPQGMMNAMMAQLKQFSNSIAGDPTQILQGKLNSGEMTQSQYDQLRKMAIQIASRMGIKR